MHRQLPDGDITMHENHYTLQLSPLTSPKEAKLDSLRGTTDITAYMSCLGAVAWMENTRAEIAMFVCALQRAATTPKCIDMKRLNTVLRFINRHPMETSFKRLTGPFKSTAVSDSALKRQHESPRPAGIR